jgi:hypothetical protein
LILLIASPIEHQSLPRVVGPYTLSNLCQRLKSSPVFSDHVIVKLSCDQTGSSQNGGLTFVTCGFAFSMNTPVKQLKIECFVCNTPNNRILFCFVYMEFMRCMTDHRIKNNPLSSVENKQRSFSNISYMVFFTYFTIYGVIITGLYQVTL